MKAFTLVEILVALLVSSFLMITGLQMGNAYAMEWRWQSFLQLFEDELSYLRYRTEQQIVSSRASEELLKEESLKYHLYLEKDQETEEYWILATRPIASPEAREVLWYERKTFDMTPFLLRQMNVNDHDADRILLTWEGAFRRWSIDSPPSSLLSGDALSDSFTLSEDICDGFFESCFSQLMMEANEGGPRRLLTIDAHQGLSVERIL